MPLSELEKAGLEYLMKAEVDEIIYKVETQQGYVDRIDDQETRHFLTHYSQLQYLKGLAQGMARTLEVLRKHL